MSNNSSSSLESLLQLRNDSYYRLREYCEVTGLCSETPVEKIENDTAVRLSALYYQAAYNYVNAREAADKFATKQRHIEVLSGLAADIKELRAENSQSLRATNFELNREIVVLKNKILDMEADSKKLRKEISKLKTEIAGAHLKSDIR